MSQSFIQLTMSQTLSQKLGFRTELVWTNIFGFVLLHYGLFYGLYLVFSLQTKLMTVIYVTFIMLGAGYGVTVGNHRLFAHRAYKANAPLRALLLFGQTLAGQNCAYIWARDHRQHHKYSDTDADPHNSRRGFLFCHMGWLMMRKLPEVKEKGKNISLADLEADPLIMFQRKIEVVCVTATLWPKLLSTNRFLDELWKSVFEEEGTKSNCANLPFKWGTLAYPVRYYYPLYFLIGVILPISIPVLVWGETLENSIYVAYFIRQGVVLHGTWTVNSIAHFWGLKPYSKDIRPVESKFVAFITSGEGWHNFHHTFPWDYRTGEWGIGSNMSAKIIDFFADLGWAYDLKSASPAMIERRMRNHGDGSRPPLQNGMERNVVAEEVRLENYEILNAPEDMIKTTSPRPVAAY